MMTLRRSPKLALIAAALIVAPAHAQRRIQDAQNACGVAVLNDYIQANLALMQHASEVETVMSVDAHRATQTSRAFLRPLRALQ